MPAANTSSASAENIAKKRSHLLSIFLAIMLFLFLLLQINMLVRASPSPSGDKTAPDLNIELMK